MRRSGLVALLLVAWWCTGLSTSAAAQMSVGADWVAGTRTSSAPVVVYLLRHAEKLDDSRDPPLSEAGTARATELARLLSEAGVTHIWSTDYQRTRLTAQPLATRLGLTVSGYDPSKLTEFAAQLRGTPGRHLVVGHSNTTPQLVTALGGNAGVPYQDTEYDRFYVVIIGEEGPATIQLRFGQTR
jgi:phosphohistidine phosphatase SixA